jgi:hypothetical protein
MNEEEMTIEAAKSMMEHGIDGPRRTDLIWKIKVFMRLFGLGDRTPNDLIKALDCAGLKLVHGQTDTPLHSP